jgi:hypothetical protein
MRYGTYRARLKGIILDLIFFQFLFDCASSANPEVKEVALHMFASVPGVFGNQGMCQDNFLNFSLKDA